MIEKILSEMSFESIALRLVNHRIPSKTDELVNGNFVPAINDLVILKSLLPNDLLLEMRKDLRSQHLFSFALRYRISQLAVASHLLSADFHSVLNFSSDEISLFMSLFGEIEGQNHFPCFGINSVGVFLFPSQSGRCRAIDSYHPIPCQNQGTPFCLEHRSEIWWENESDPKLTLSKMFKFYSNLENCDLYSNEELESMMKTFWTRYGDWFHQATNLDINSCLAAFGLKSRDELNVLGIHGLQKSYYEICLKMHPDRGGSAEDFIELKMAYQHLKKQILR